jgi:hypothetical protein
MLILVTATISPRSALLQETALKDGGLDKSTPETLTTACHAASLVGAIVNVRVAHRLNWAGELLGRRGEELVRDVGSERRCLLVNENYHSRFSLQA